MSLNTIKLNESLKRQLANLSEEDFTKLLHSGGKIECNFETRRSDIFPGQLAKSYPDPHVVVDNSRNVVESVAVSIVLNKSEREELAGASRDTLNAVFIEKLAECILDIQDVARAIPKIVLMLKTPPKYVFAMPPHVAKQYLQRLKMVQS
jgi:hypothetical protein